MLKEKYRTGLNPQEKVKLGKEPMTFFTEGGIKDLAKIPMEEIDADKLTKEDVDVRLKWLGLFHRRKQQCMASAPTHPRKSIHSFISFVNPILLLHFFLQSFGKISFKRDIFPIYVRAR